jgi:hypothetical protein
MIMVGLVITVVGLGDKGFQTLELKLAGPMTVMCGGVLACVRILMCTLPHTQCAKRWCVWCAGGRGDRRELLQKETQYKDQRISLAVQKSDTTLIRFENKEVELSFENCEQNRFVRNGEKRFVGCDRQIIKPVLMEHCNDHNGKVTDFADRTKIVSDFALNGQNLQYFDVES